MSQNFEPGSYAKGDAVRYAQTRPEAVQAEWEGFVRVTEESLADVSRRELQQRAKDAGIPANQSNDALIAALANPAPNESASTQTPELPGEGQSGTEDSTSDPVA